MFPKNILLKNWAQRYIIFLNFTQTNKNG